MPQMMARKQLLHANALDALSNSVIQIVALTTSGIIVAVTGPALSLLIDAGTFLVSCLLVYQARWQVNDVEEIQEKIASFSNAVAGLRWIVTSPLLRTILGAEALHALAVGLFLSALAPFIKQLGSGPALYGLQGAFFGIGLLVGSYLIGQRPTTRIGWLYIGGILLNGLGNLLFGLSPAPLWLLPTVLLAGLGWPAWTASRQAIAQSYVPIFVRGRVFALLDMVGAITILPTYVTGGWVTDHIGARWLLVIAAATHICIGFYLSSSKVVRETRLRDQESVHSPF
jgi:hypothetical protein